MKRSLATPTARKTCFSKSSKPWNKSTTVSYTHLRAHETVLDLVCRLLLEKKTYHIRNILCMSLIHIYDPTRLHIISNASLFFTLQ
ncbi:hypothetical protein PVA38_11475 [Streptococcus pneumoniae D39]|nr:hypothetical protein PVA38_11475 [Streptococcus pneumoniae D39]